MAVNKLPEFAKNGQKNTDDLNLEDGFPVTLKPARQWFNYLFNTLALSINQIIDENYIQHAEIINHLNSDDTSNPLSALQGKTLQDNKLDKTSLTYTRAISANEGDKTNINIDNVKTGILSQTIIGTSSVNDAWWNTINIRHRNNMADGVDFGGQILFGMTGNFNILKFRAQTAGKFQNWNTVWTDQTFDPETKLDKTANAVGIISVDNRTLKPSDLSTRSVQAFFGTLNTDNSGDYADFLTLNSWNDKTGGFKNALVFNKFKQELFHYQSAFDSEKWTTKKKISYTDSDITGNANTATKLQTPRKINNIDFDGSKDITIKASIPQFDNVASNAQADTALADGEYLVSAWTENPMGFYSFGMLRVYVHNATIHQIYYCHRNNGNGSVAVRQSWDAGKTWEGWRVLDANVFPNNKLVLVGDDVYIGDQNIEGCLVVQASSGTDGGIVFRNKDGQERSRVQGDQFTGNAASSTKLKTARSIGGASFDGSSDVNPNYLYNIGRYTAPNNKELPGTNNKSFSVGEIYTNGYPVNYGNVINIGGAGQSQLAIGWHSSGIYHRGVTDISNEWSSWVKLAYVTDNVASASKLETPRNIALTGAISGNANFDGSGNISIETATTSSCRAWLLADTTVTPPKIMAGNNVESITQNGIGDFTITFVDDMPSEFYAIFGSCADTSYGGGGLIKVLSKGITDIPILRTKKQVRIGIGGGSSGRAYNTSSLSIGIFC